MEDDASETLYSRADTGSPDLDKEVPGSDEFEKMSREGRGTWISRRIDSRAISLLSL